MIWCDSGVSRVCLQPVSVLFLLRSLRSQILDWGGCRYVTTLSLSRENHLRRFGLPYPSVKSAFQSILVWGPFVGMKSMSNVLTMRRRGDGNYLEQHLSSLRSTCLQSNIPSLSSILLSPHILRKPSFELWDEKERVEPEYHSATKPWILERPPGKREEATEEMPSTPSSSFSSTRRFCQMPDDLVIWWQDDIKIKI